MGDHVDQTIVKTVLRGTLAGHATACKVTERERAERLANLTDEQASRLFRANLALAMTPNAP
jgi:hypothetical protein